MIMTVEEYFNHYSVQPDSHLNTFTIDVRYGMVLDVENWIFQEYEEREFILVEGSFSYDAKIAIVFHEKGHVSCKKKGHKVCKDDRIKKEICAYKYQLDHCSTLLDDEHLSGPLKWSIEQIRNEEEDKSHKSAKKNIRENDILKKYEEILSNSPLYEI